MRRREQKKSLAIPLFIVFIMTFSVLGYAIFQGTSGGSENYNGYKFTRVQDQFWRVKVDGEYYDFYFLPQEVLGIEVENMNVPNIIYLTSNPIANYSAEDLMAVEMAKFELKEELVQTGRTPLVAFSEEYQGKGPITCANATANVGVINIDVSDDTKIEVKGTCVDILGIDGRDVIRAKEVFLMKLLGILE